MALKLYWENNLSLVHKSGTERVNGINVLKFQGSDDFWSNSKFQLSNFSPRPIYSQIWRGLQIIGEKHLLWGLFNDIVSINYGGKAILCHHDQICHSLCQHTLWILSYNGDILNHTLNPTLLLHHRPWFDHSLEKRLVIVCKPNKNA